MQKLLSNVGLSSMYLQISSCKNRTQCVLSEMNSVKLDTMDTIFLYSIFARAKRLHRPGTGKKSCEGTM